MVCFFSRLQCVLGHVHNNMNALELISLSGVLSFHLHEAEIVVTEIRAYQKKGKLFAVFL